MDKYTDKNPAIILVGAQLGENIGMVARAMLNFGLTDLRLVQPREGWDRVHAYKSAAGADALIDGHKVYGDVAGAIADLGYVVASTARLRDMVKPILTPPAASAVMHTHAEANTKSGILFGREKSGLDNDDISLCDVICRVPLNPDFSSLNLAQAVLLFGYEWYQAGDKTAAIDLPTPDTQPASRAELTAMFAHLQSALDAAGFLTPPEKAPAMMRNLRNLFHRASMTEQDVRTFRGVINALLRFPRQRQDEAAKAQIAALSRPSGDGENDIDN
ncbi:MAG: RNA methyltransferase [Alphaproteobacteria bacterium]|nr:RNA methyltransferase [Alphaproteobacteria bacterium]MBE8220534.1 RNA methyltransferase [Alphaproteobacteria bacterium]